MKKYNLTNVQKRNLTRHIELVHEGKKPQKCSICDYTCLTTFEYRKKTFFNIILDIISQSYKCFLLNFLRYVHIIKYHDNLYSLYLTRCHCSNCCDIGAFRVN